MKIPIAPNLLFINGYIKQQSKNKLSGINQNNFLFYKLYK